VSNSIRGRRTPQVLIALTGNQLVGSLVTNVTFSAFELTRSLYIRDLYVSRRLRRTGVGTALVKAGARLAVEEGFSALEWTTGTANAAARRMYKACGAAPLDRTYYRLFDDGLAAAANAGAEFWFPSVAQSVPQRCIEPDNADATSPCYLPAGWYGE
jgi:ribosomal protein S18 acetylase RimI-like enzyme